MTRVGVGLKIASVDALPWPEVLHSSPEAMCVFGSGAGGSMVIAERLTDVTSPRDEQRWWPIFFFY